MIQAQRAGEGTKVGENYCTDFLGKLAGKVTNGDHMIMGCFSTSYKCE